MAKRVSKRFTVHQVPWGEDVEGADVVIPLGKLKKEV